MPYTEQQESHSNYPTREEHSRRWEELAREIAADRASLTGSPQPAAEGKRGSLVIIGSGIQGVGFSMEAEAYLRAADKVFYCVSNPPTQVWLHEVRPDAYDLYVFYDDTKPRFNTYMQMSEAMLHYVRKGQRVVGVYYGHPGIFVLSTHRAIAIARREGHEAVMKPGISALDCLCADLGIDPAYPGMQTFEASEVLLRKRPLDTSVHVVLWQVGLIGEQGYRRKGFINDKFPILVEYLQQYYGEHYEVTHYVGARHCTFEPTMAVHKLSEMLDPRVRATFTGISTFYIPPKDAAQTDPEMAARLGFVPKPGQKLAQMSASRDIALYGPRELAAIDEFENFRVPHEYLYQPKTRAGEFLVELTHNVALQDLYKRSPEEAVSDDVYPGLSTLEKHLLATRNENYAHVAAKGALATFSPNERLILDMHRDSSLASSFRSFLVDNYRRGDARAALDAWVNAAGYEGATVDFFGDATERINASMLVSWSGVYATPNTDFVLTIIGSPELNDLSLVYANLTPVKGFTFNNSTLIWRAEDGNPHNATLRFEMPGPGDGDAFMRSLSGRYWEEGAEEPAEPNLRATEVLPGSNPLSAWTAKYETRVTRDGSEWSKGPAVLVYTPRPDESPSEARVLLDGSPVDSAGFDGDALSWGNNRLTFMKGEGKGAGKALFGSLDGYWKGGLNLKGASLPDYDAPYRGRYSSFSFVKNRWKPSGDFHFEEGVVLFGQRKVEGVAFEHNLLSWSGAGDGPTNGEVHFSIDPTTQLPKFVGYVWNSGPRPKHPNVQGVYALDAAHAPSEVRPPVPVGGGPLPARVFEVLGAIGLQSRDPASLFIWSRWQRACFMSRLLNRLAPQILDLVLGAAHTKSS